MMSNDMGIECELPVYSLRLAEHDLRLELLLEQARRTTREQCRAVVELRRVVLASATPQIIAAGQALAQAFARKATLFAFGSAGNATDAHDLVKDLLHPPFSHWRALPALALHDSPCATGEDKTGFEQIFARQILTLGHAGDIAFGISSGGAEHALLLALEQAKSQEMLTIALVGTDAGPLLHAPAIDFCFAVPGEHALRVQEVQATLHHTLLEVVHACVESRPPARERRSSHAMREKRAFLLDMR